MAIEGKIPHERYMNMIPLTDGAILSYANLIEKRIQQKRLTPADKVDITLWARRIAYTMERRGVQ